MTLSPHDQISIYDFAGISEVAETTTHLLLLALQEANRASSPPSQEPDPIEHIILQQARDYLSTVREGFVLSVRTTDINQRSEFRYLLRRVLTDWDQLSRELGLDLEPGADIGSPSEPAPHGSVPVTDPPALERVRKQLLAFGMAVVAMGYLPRMPSRQVTFPQSHGKPPTYADIPVPHTAGEMLWRIEELEETVWQMMSRDLGDLVQRRYGPVRRTYGFFETSAWLSVREVKRFGIKRNRPSAGLF